MTDPEPKLTQMQDRLDDLGREIEDAKHQAKEVLPEHDGDEESFAETGTAGRGFVDDAIAPG